MGKHYPKVNQSLIQKMVMVKQLQSTKVKMVNGIVHQIIIKLMQDPTIYQRLAQIEHPKKALIYHMRALSEHIMD